MAITQKLTLQSYVSRRRILSPPGFGEVMSRDMFKLYFAFLHFADNTNKANYEGPAKLYKILVLPHLNYKFQKTINFKTYSFPGRIFQLTNPLHYGRYACLSKNIYH
jgi:hypothetical protein